MKKPKMNKETKVIYTQLKYIQDEAGIDFDKVILKAVLSAYLTGVGEGLRRNKQLRKAENEK